MNRLVSELIQLPLKELKLGEPQQAINMHIFALGYAAIMGNITFLAIFC